MDLIPYRDVSGPEHCSICRFWRPGDDRAEGQCRRSAPEVGFARVGDVAAKSGAVWPITAATDWCGAIVRHLVPCDAATASA